MTERSSHYWAGNDRLLAQRALKLDFEPVIYALAVEFVRAWQRLHHLPSLQCINANRTVRLILFLLWGSSNACSGWSSWLLILERSIGVNNGSDLFRRELLFFFILLLLKLLLLCIEIRINLSFFLIIVLSIFIWLAISLGIVLLLVMLMMALGHIGIEGVSSKVHLDVLRTHVLNVEQHLLNVAKHIHWHSASLTKICLTTSALREPSECVSTKVELEILRLLLMVLLLVMMILMLTMACVVLVKMLILLLRSILSTCRMLVKFKSLPYRFCC